MKRGDVDGRRTILAVWWRSSMNTKMERSVLEDEDDIGMTLNEADGKSIAAGRH